VGVTEGVKSSLVLGEEPVEQAGVPRCVR